MICSICGGTSFTKRPVLWRELIDEWQLSLAEVEYINRQQGECCDLCGANLRSIALSDAIRHAAGTNVLLRELAQSPIGRKISILEINEAGNLTSTLRNFPAYTFGAYPELDMHAIPYVSDTFDIVVHSDTLEHVENPIHALAECWRVLKVGGALCFTVPIVVGRLTRNRNGLPPSYHGNPETASTDLMVQTEFGADAWTYVMEAGFKQLSLHVIEYPAAISLCAKK